MFTKTLARYLQPFYGFDVNAEVKTQPCQCELCQPNWRTSRAIFEAQPVEPQQKFTLEEAHARKVAKSMAADYRPDLELELR